MQVFTCQVPAPPCGVPRQPPRNHSPPTPPLWRENAECQRKWRPSKTGAIIFVNRIISHPQVPLAHGSLSLPHPSIIDPTSEPALTKCALPLPRVRVHRGRPRRRVGVPAPQVIHIRFGADAICSSTRCRRPTATGTAIVGRVHPSDAFRIRMGRSRARRHRITTRIIKRERQRWRIARAKARTIVGL